MAWTKLYSETQTLDNQSFDTTLTTATTFREILFIQYGHTGNSSMTFNADTGSNYTERFCVSGGTDSTRTSGVANVNVMTAGTGDYQTFTIMKMINISAEEKLAIYHTVHTTGTGNTAPVRVEGGSKWINTSAQITRTQISDSGDGFDTSSNLTEFGTD